MSEHANVAEQRESSADAVALLVRLTAAVPTDVTNCALQVVRCKYCSLHGGNEVDFADAANHDESCDWRLAVEWLRASYPDAPAYPEWRPVENRYAVSDSRSNVCKAVEYGKHCLLIIESPGLDSSVVMLPDDVRLCRKVGAPTDSDVQGEVLASHVI